jgi:DNA-binding XRE family transcriptional regulator
MELSINYKKIVDVRKKLGFTQSDVSELINVRRFTYSKKERGLVPISLKEAFVISKLFGMTIEELFFEN